MFYGLRQPFTYYITSTSTLALECPYNDPFFWSDNILYLIQKVLDRYHLHVLQNNKSPKSWI